MTEQATETIPAPKKRPYGVWCVHCPCGWITLGKGEKDPPTYCEACHEESIGEMTDDRRAGDLLKPYARYSIDVACMVMTVSDLRSKRVWEHAEKHGLGVYQVSKNRWVVLLQRGSTTVKFGTEERPGGAVGYIQLDAVCGPADWQTVMAYLREKTPMLPAYLTR